MNSVDIRQSPNWTAYLNTYGWKTLVLSNGSVLRVRPLIFKHCVAKLQRPHVLKQKDLLELLHICKQKRVLYIKLFPNWNQNLSLLKSFKFHETKAIDIPPRTMIINLQTDTAQLWSKMSKSCVYSINRSNREGDYVEIYQNPKPAHVEKFTELVKTRGKEKGFYTQSVKDQLNKIAIFKEESFLFFIFDSSKELLGAKMFLGFNNNIWYMHGGTTPLGQKRKGGYKLMWDAILYFRDLGYGFMDLEGLADDRLPKQTSKWRGYTNFKLKFGGDIVDYPLSYSRVIFPF